MKTHKLLFNLLRIWLLLLSAAPLRAEYHVIQAGENLITIAEAKRVHAGFLLSTEQIMLTLYQLNKPAFADGDINQLIPQARLLIPDNSEEYVKLDKTQAQRKLKALGYLPQLNRLANGLATQTEPEALPVSQRETKAHPAYQEVIQTLENHQQTLEALKAENARLSSKFDLLEKAIGRLVIVQGLLTDNIVQVKNKLLEGTVSGPTSKTLKSPSKAERNSSSTLSPVETPTLLPATEPTENSLPTPALQTVVAALATTQKQQLDVATETKLPPTTAGKLFEAQPEDATRPLLAAPVTPSPPPSIPSVQSDEELTDILLGIALVLLIGLIAGWLWVLYQARVKKMSIGDDFEALDNSNKTKMAANNDNEQRTPFDNHKTKKAPLVAPRNVTSPKASKIAKNDDELDNELNALLEHLDMCLLCGDYPQAHALTLKALETHKNSPVLLKKLAFIERKTAKTPS